jgi:hypothetical protein
MAWVLADGTKHMIQLNGSNQKRWPTAPARHGAAVPESISAYTEFNSARRIRLRVTPEIKPRAFFKPSIIRGYDAVEKPGGVLEVLEAAGGKLRVAQGIRARFKPGDSDTIVP